MNRSPDDVRLLHLHTDDNVCAVARTLPAGEEVCFAGRRLKVAQIIAVGHKIAIVDIARGSKVRKYGAVIGSATQDIAAGDWVHTHNLASDYIPTYARGELEERAPSRGVAVIEAYLRPDGSKGIRNIVVVAYLVECAHHVAREIAAPFGDREVHLIGFPGCFPNAYARRLMERLCTHPNVSGALLVSLGCESFDRQGLSRAIEKSGRPVRVAVIQDEGGTRSSIDRGREAVEELLALREGTPRAPMQPSELVVATICGGSDATSGLTANPAIGRAFDLLVEAGAAAIFEETGELIGCEQHMAQRAQTPELGEAIVASVQKAARYYEVLGHGSFAAGNYEGGLTTQEEKSLGAYCKSGASPIAGMLKPGDAPPGGGLYLLDVVPDGEVRYGFPNISDNAEIVEMIACGAHLTLFATGRGSVVGSALAPVIKVCANPETYRRMQDDMDVDAGRILESTATLDEVGREIHDLCLQVAAGAPTKSEALGHREFILTYKSFEPLGPSCLPGR